MANEEHWEENKNNSNSEHSDLPELGINTSGAPDLETLVQAASEEYQNIDKTLDEIDTWMTKIEEQNDNLFTELEQLLESSRQARKELQEQHMQDESDKQQDKQKPMQQDGS